MDDLITQAEAAEIRRVSRAAITDLVKRGRLRTVEMFGKKLVFRSEVVAFQKESKGWPKGKSRKLQAEKSSKQASKKSGKK